VTQLHSEQASKTIEVLFAVLVVKVSALTASDDWNFAAIFKC
jgi:hypothetical protein